MTANIEKYNQISKIVFKQRELISKATSIMEIDRLVAMAAGFLEGLVLSGVILRSDADSYMCTLSQFGKSCGERLWINAM